MAIRAIALLAVMFMGGISSAEVAVQNLRCEYLADPLGIDVARPRLNWVIAALKSEIGNLKSEIPRGQKQTAYQVLAASTPELLAKDKGDLWDSGKVASDQCVAVRHAGLPFVSETRYWRKSTRTSNLHRKNCRR